MLITGWVSCTWLTCVIGPMANPRYQAKNPQEHTHASEVGERAPFLRHAVPAAAASSIIRIWMADRSASCSGRIIGPSARKPS